MPAAAFAGKNQGEKCLKPEIFVGKEVRVGSGEASEKDFTDKSVSKTVKNEVKKAKHSFGTLFQENCLKKGDTLMKRNILVILAVVITVAIALPVILNASTIETSRSYNTFMAEDRLFERNFYDPYNLFIFNPEKDTVLWKNGNMDPYTDHIYTLELSTLGTDLTAGAMYDIDPQTARVSLVSAEKHSCMTPWRDKVMCILDDTKIISMDYHGGNRTVIAQYDHPISNLYADENLVFFIKENKICRLHIASGVTEQVCNLDEFGFELKDFTPVTTRIINLVYTNPIWEECMKANGYSYGEITDKAELQQKTGIAVNELETHETLLDLFDEYGITEYISTIVDTKVDKEIQEVPEWVCSAEDIAIDETIEKTEIEPQARPSCYFTRPLVYKGKTYDTGSFFSTGGTPCSCHGENGCTTPCTCIWAFGGKQCHGFALATYAYYFGFTANSPHSWRTYDNPNSEIYTKSNFEVNSLTLTELIYFLKNLKPGALIRIVRGTAFESTLSGQNFYSKMYKEKHQHSIILTGVWDDKVEIYHGNTKEDKPCLVERTKVDYTWFTKLKNGHSPIIWYYIDGFESDPTVVNGTVYPHIAGLTYDGDYYYHWKNCSACGFATQKEPHTYNSIECTVCGSGIPLTPQYQE